MDAPSVLLLGSGYTLSRLGAALGRERIVLTSRRAEQVDGWRGRGYVAERVDSSSLEDLRGIFRCHPELTTVVDSVPPQRGVAVEKLRADAVERGRAFKAAGITRVVYLSTTGVFGVEDGGVVSESTPSAPKNPLAEARYAVERGYSASGVGFTAVRIPAIYGPGRGLGLSLQHGGMKLIEGGKRWTNRVHVDDLVRYLGAMVDTAELPPVLCVGDAEPALQRKVVEFYAERFGLPVPDSISLEQARAAGLYTQLANQRIDSSLARSLLGVTLNFPSYREGAGAEFEAELDPLG
ncbi:MAG: ActC protein [Pseudomonadota bacterium]